MRYGAMMNGMLGVLFACSAGLVALPLIYPKVEWSFAAVMGAIPIIVAIPIVIEARSTAVVSTDGVRTRSIWRGERTLAWKDIDRMSFSGLSGWFSLHGRDGTRLRISGLFNGIQVFARVLETHEPECGGKRAVAKWRKALGGFGIRVGSPQRPE